MNEVGIRSLKQNASAVVAVATAGATVTITDRGRPVALLTPIPESALQALLAAGQGRPARRSLVSLGAPAPGRALSAELAVQRDEERY